MKPLTRTVAVLAMLSAAACDQQAAPSAPQARSRLRAAVVGNAAANVQANDQLALERPTSPDGDSIITEGRARSLAMAYVRSFGRTFHETWEKQRGGRIDLSTLSVGPRIFFARSAYGAFPRGFHPAMRKSYGPYYLVTLLSGGEPVITMAVSAYNTDMRTNASGQLVMPPLNGMGFIHEGVPRDPSRYRLQSPEEAVLSASDATGALVSAVPVLVMPNHEQTPLLAAWLIELDRDVVSSNDRGQRALVRRVFVGPRASDRLTKAALEQEAEEFGAGPALSGTNEFGVSRHFRVAAAPDRSLRREAVTFEHGRAQ